MAKPSRDAIQNGLNGWDADVNNNFIRLFDRPIPIFLHTGDETDIETAYAAAAYEECLAVVDHTTIGLTYYMVDKNHPSGSAKWVPLGSYISDPPVTFNTTGTLDWDARKVICNPAGNITMTLPTAASVAGKTINIKNVSTNQVTVASASNIDGAASFLIATQYFNLTLYSDGATYHIQ